MSKESVLSEEDEQDATGFQRSTSPLRPARARRSETHYGCSPAFDIDVRDRKVLPPDQLVIRKGDLIEFVPVSVAAETEGGESAPPDVEMDAQGKPVPGVYRSSPTAVRVPQTTKQPGDCADEMRWAYADANPWGFQVFDVLTGLDPEDAFKVFKSVMPRRMNIPEAIAHLESLEITEDFYRDADAEVVRQQLLSGFADAALYSRTVLEGSQQEIADRNAGSKGKAQYDARDRKVSAALGEVLPNPRASAPPPVNVPAGTDPAVIKMMMEQAEEVGRLKATIEQQQAAKQRAPKVRAEAQA